ncbi:Conserved_hypothetical protein [Hexamita inflata]|uniref:Uncharacterized protein n=2 Tax=Hexamita inflata TaxID=28002 RepID=A0AA86UBH0_9EUKA|nr:Conserved hypothetical protein [Hexamita inflata]
MKSYEIFMQRSQLFERAQQFDTQLKGKFSDYINYLLNVWVDNEQIITFLQKVEVMSVTSCGIERVFSFFHRTTSHFLRKQITPKTLNAMSYIYVDKIQPEMQQWKMNKSLIPDKSFQKYMDIYDCPETEPDENSEINDADAEDNEEF